MKVRRLQENLRRTLRSRIAQGDLTGLQLAEQTGYRQAHISNFLNRRRSLSLDGIDKVLNVQHLSILDLLDPEELERRASAPPPPDGEFDNIPLVDGSVAVADARIAAQNVEDVLKFRKSFLRKLRSEISGNRQNWERFVLVRIDAREGLSMYPRLLPGATVLIDRHYNSLKPYRKGEHNLYAVSHNGMFAVKYVEVAGRHLVLRPHNPVYPVEVMLLQEGRSIADYIAGRICYVGIET